ncbi:hypothetical protein BSKO_09886 [Bryopsis sp. KO-2023]|nr:hypothetical protein BSKO_09886 [Bryopsis sp. KO-2023]
MASWEGIAKLVYVLILLLAPAHCRPRIKDSFIGWNGATYDPKNVWDTKGPSRGSNNKWIEQLSWKPRAFLYHNFLSPEECDHIVHLAAPKMKRSTVVGVQNENAIDNIRTSYGTFLRRLQDDVTTTVEERVANWTQLPLSHQEDMQVLRYGISQKYGAHQDVLDEGSKRYATILMYLNDCPGGGETAFPEGSEWTNPVLGERYGPWSECAEGHVAAKPKKGDALLFFSLFPDGTTGDPASTHTGCPILEGVKWTATKWVHVGPFRPEFLGVEPVGEQDRDPGFCEDFEETCTDWAKAGECERNPEYMIGEGSQDGGACRLACGTCEPCKNKKDKCYNENRLQAGYLSLEDLEK